MKRSANDIFNKNQKGKTSPKCRQYRPSYPLYLSIGLLLLPTEVGSKFKSSVEIIDQFDLLNLAILFHYHSANKSASSLELFETPYLQQSRQTIHYC